MLLTLIYLAFISLGLPDAVLGAAWPVMAPSMDASVSAMGLVTMIISAGTIYSSLQSHRLTNRFGVHTVTSFSVVVTALSLLGFGYAPSLWILCLLAIPYGLGAGCVDAALNNYVAIHFESKHMNWLHCMWGVGATAGPYLMGAMLTGGKSYGSGYGLLFVIQGIIALVLFASRNVWQGKGQTGEPQGDSAPLRLKEVFEIKGVPEVAMAFFCFSAVEQTTGLWASSYLVYQRQLDVETAAGLGALFYFGITLGRMVSGLLSIRYSDRQLIRWGTKLMALGVVVLALPLPIWGAYVGLFFIGSGSAPVYPAIIHSTPIHFGVSQSPAITGIEMACAYTGGLLMPPLFGVLAKGTGFFIYPIYIGVFVVAMAVFYACLLGKVEKTQ